MKWLFLILLISFQAEAQNLYSLHTQWDDDIKQWDLLLNEGELEGSIEMKWRLRNDLTEWTFRVGDRSGTIQQKWDNNANVWELRSGNSIIRISTVWSGDYSSWRISDGEVTLKIERPVIQPDPIEWRAANQLDDQFFWYNENPFDIRDWIIEDYLPEEYSFEMKLAAVFVSILHSI